MFGSRLLQRNRHSGQRSKLEQGQEGRISPASHGLFFSAILHCTV